MALKYTGMSYSDIEKKVKELNSQLAVPLSKDELENTILKTTAKACINGQ